MMEWNEFRTRLLSDPEVRQHYNELAPAYRLVSELLEQRKRLGITQKELAKRMGTSQSVVSRLESGEFLNVTLRTLSRMARVLDCSLQMDLIPSTRDKSEQGRAEIAPAKV
jgi:transcriptional regulator with XRE-family HTH domain